MTYRLIAKVDLSIFSKIRDVVDGTNHAMSLFGFDEKIAIVNEEAELAVLTSNRELTDEERYKIMAIAQEEYNKSDLLRDKITITDLIYSTDR